jgi:hypothetical protein
MLKKIASPSGLILGFGSLAAFWWMRRQQPKSSTTAAPPKNLQPPPPSPFVPGSGCTQVAGVVEVMRWVEKVVEPIAKPLLEAYYVALSDHEGARLAVREIVDELYAKTVPECKGYQTSATRKIWKALWCEVVMALVKKGKLDEELDDVLRLCMDDNFDPRAPREPRDPSTTPDPPLPPFPMPMDGSAAGPPPNVSTASSR